MPRFVVLRHQSPRGVHWDLMLEKGVALATWALEQPPSVSEPIAARALGDHRLAYLDYEGPLSGERGSVTRCDCGTYELEQAGDDEWIVELAGKQLQGRAVLRRLPDEVDRWRVTFSVVPAT